MDKYTHSLLKTFEKRANLSLVELGAIYNVGALDMVEPVKYCKHLGYIEIIERDKDDGCDSQELKMNTQLKITMKGRSALDEEVKTRRKECLNTAHKWINTSLAVAAFIMSIISLVKN